MSDTLKCVTFELATLAQRPAQRGLEASGLQEQVFPAKEKFTQKKLVWNQSAMLL